ncbi:MAG: hypothetical protein KJO38_07900, partial [Gammaproteobacteria bacterium]|nr:hypothetical protein [Gammaproteobacteria bacterium]
MTEWISDLKTLTADGDTAVLVSVVHTAGSTPREAGARMCVTAEAMRGTVGGGRLEFEALRLARERLAAPDAGAGALHV